MITKILSEGYLTFFKTFFTYPIFLSKEKSI